jgi:hypothetical protein
VAEGVYFVMRKKKTRARYGSAIESVIGSFFDENDLQFAFTYLITIAYVAVTQGELPNAFTSAFEVLFDQINITPPRTPMTITWNKDLPHYDSTRDIQQFKALNAFRKIRMTFLSITDP